VNVDMNDGNIMNNWFDSLSAAWPGVQVFKVIVFCNLVLDVSSGYGEYSYTNLL